MLRPRKRIVPINKRKLLNLNSNLKKYAQEYKVFSKLSSSQKLEVHNFIKKNHRYLADKEVVSSLLNKLNFYEKQKLIKFLTLEKKEENLKLFYNSLDVKEKEYVDSHLRIFKLGQSIKESNIIRNGYIDVLYKLNSENVNKLYKKILDLFSNLGNL